MTNISGPDFITLLVSDLEASFRFYTEKIGLNESSEKRPNAHAFTTAPCGLAIRQSSDKRKAEHPRQGIIGWLLSSDASVLHDELKQRGVLIVEDFGRALRHDILIQGPGRLYPNGARCWPRRWRVKRFETLLHRCLVGSVFFVAQVFGSESL